MHLSLVEPEPIEPAPVYVAEERPQHRAFEFIEHLRQWVFVVFLAAVAYLLLSRFVLQLVQVQGQSMVPTLHDTERYFLNRCIYCLRQPQRGDVVVLKDPSDGDYAVKRIVALSGDSVYFKGGRVYVNGQRLREPYLYPNMPTYTCGNVEEELVVCGRNQFFVLGDNRGNSYDSRIYGPVSRANILGALVH
jgi:signal peptidase I